MNSTKTLLSCFVAMLLSFNVSAQQLTAGGASVSVQELPEYIIITSENTRLLGGINIMIDYKRSMYKDQLSELELLLQEKKKLRIRNQTDLLNTLSELGFEYIDAYNANSDSTSDDEIIGSQSKFRTNMVFRKKAQYRN